MRPLLALGRALSNDQLKGTIFLVNGHTDAKGGAEYNQDLTLIAVGHGKTQLKNPTDPFAGENRRVQVVNTEQPVAGGR
jgi:outer membrane protein OmpA-like peptidoglycan-associated protein